MPSEPPTLLALRALKLGDLLVAVPALRAVRRSLPEHRVVLATTGWLAPIVPLIHEGGRAAVDELLPVAGLDAPIPLPPGTIDIALNLHGAGPESDRLLEALAPRRLLGHASGSRPGPVWVDGMLERERWARLVSWHGMRAEAEELGLATPSAAPVVDRAVVIHVGAAYGARNWPVERFATVATALIDDGETVVITGGETDAARVAAVADAAAVPAEHRFAGSLRLDELAALIARARLVVSADTGAAHLASAYGTPSVVIFGPAPPSEWGPPPGPHLVLTDESARRGDVFAVDPDPALLAVSAAETISCARALLS